VVGSTLGLLGAVRAADVGVELRAGLDTEILGRLGGRRRGWLAVRVGLDVARPVRRRRSAFAGCPAWRQGPADSHAQFFQLGLHLLPVLLRRRKLEVLLVEPRGNLLVLFIAVAVERILGLEIQMIVFLNEVA
jgi:hypothetical protein